MAVKTRVYDGSRYFDDEESQSELLADAIETGDASYVAHALGQIARSRGVDQLASVTGLSRDQLYDALLAEDTAEQAIVHRVLDRLRELAHSKDAA